MHEETWVSCSLYFDAPHRGFPLGLASHGIGTDGAIQVKPTAWAFAVLGLGLIGVLTAILAPWPVPLLIERLY